jgi:hypothetical protein
MQRHIMVSTIFRKNRLNRLLKPIIGKLRPRYLLQTRQVFQEMTMTPAHISRNISAALRNARAIALLQSNWQAQRDW